MRQVGLVLFLLDDRRYALHLQAVERVVPSMEVVVLPKAPEVVTVIEVGVDVPNASIMVVEHAERFGLSQMHQLRGRIGRGTAQSYCVLMTGGKVSVEAEARLDAMVRTQNGFEIAELDLQQRGPGEFFGTKQAGMPNFRVANLLRDRDILELARSEARMVVEGPNEQISQQEIANAVMHLRAHWNRRYGLVEVG